MLIIRFNTNIWIAGRKCFEISNSRHLIWVNCIYFLKWRKFIRLLPTVEPTVIAQYINKSFLSFTNKNKDKVANVRIATALIVINLKSSTP